MYQLQRAWFWIKQLVGWTIEFKLAIKRPTSTLKERIAEMRRKQVPCVECKSPFDWAFPKRISNSEGEGGAWADRDGFRCGCDARSSYIYSNFDHRFNDKVIAQARETGFSYKHPATHFFGYVRWDKRRSTWIETVWVDRRVVETIKDENLVNLIKRVCDKYGRD